MLRVGGEFERRRSGQAGHFDPSTAKQAEDTDRYLAMKVASVQNEQRMGRQPYLEVQVTALAAGASWRRRRLTRQTQALTGEQARWHGDRQRAWLLQPAAAGTLGAVGLAQETAPGAAVADGRCTAPAGDPATTAAASAGHGIAVLHAATATTPGTADAVHQFDALATAESCLFEGQRQRLRQVIAGSLLRRRLACARPALTGPAIAGRSAGLRLSPRGQPLRIEKQLVGCVHPPELGLGGR